jgi:hypothetical protein
LLESDQYEKKPRPKGLKPPGGALFWRNAGKHHVANYELKPEIATDGS